MFSEIRKKIDAIDTKNNYEKYEYSKRYFNEIYGWDSELRDKFIDWITEYLDI